jgi:hypothetical protein
VNLSYTPPALQNKEPTATAVSSAGLAWLAAAIERGEELDPSGILSELSACSYLTNGVVEALHREGVDIRVLRLGDIDEPRLARVEYRGNPERFEFVDDGGQGAMIFAALDQLGVPVDLCAWSPPRATALWLGHGALLGAERVLAPRIHEHYLMVHESPLAWLRASRKGVVVLDMNNAAPLLRDQRLLVTSPDYGAELEEALTLRPKIFIDDEDPPE